VPDGCGAAPPFVLIADSSAEIQMTAGGRGRTIRLVRLGLYLLLRSDLSWLVLAVMLAGLTG